jgi:hypothetical protein
MQSEMAKMIGVNKAAHGRKWKMAEWMEPFRPYFCNTGGNSIEEMANANTSPEVNLPLSTLEACVKSQIILLSRLHNKGKI